jgi:2,4-dienoyl-CoA reductase-like NADH-dependent reductase (Old Yellow Enzyme family)/thioredoxin reductase
MYDALLKPFQLRHLTLRNRVMSTAHEPNYTDKGRLTERYIRYHVEKARGGLALTMFGGSCCVSPDSPAAFGQLACVDDSVIPEFQALAERVHAEGAALMIQLTHMGRRTSWDAAGWLPPIAPSPVREPAHRSFPKEMDDHDIRRVCKDFAEAARRAREGGLDGVELSAAHGHLIDQFWTPTVNRRTDRYGGSLENRVRFGLEVIEYIRRLVGTDFIVGMRISGDELLEGGLGPEDCLAIGRLYADSGMVDFINVMGGSAPNLSALANAVPEMWAPIAPFLPLASAMRRELGLPIFHAQRIADLLTATRAIEEGHVDMIAMTRAQIADPHLVRKLLEDRVDDIRQCVGAGYCIDRIYIGKDALCIQNPATGRETTMPHLIARARHLRRVVVVGGGPAGMEAARVCAERGHQVILYEQREKLGGQINLARNAGWRSALGGVARWLEAQIRKRDVEIRLETRATEQAVLADSPNIVVIATGGRPNRGEWLRAGREHVLSTWDILSEAVAPAGEVLLYDDHGQHQGASCAEFLAARGSRVDFITPDRHAGEELGSTNIAPHMKRLYEAGVTFAVDLRLVEVYREGHRLCAVLRNEFTGVEEERLADQIVVEHGTLPNDELFQALRRHAANDGIICIDALLAGRPQIEATADANGLFLFRVGDAVASRNIHAAIYDSLRLCKDF